MPEHVHLLVNEPEKETLAEAIHFLKLSFAKRVRARRVGVEEGPFWQKRYYDRNVRDAHEFTEKLRYLHRHYAFREVRPVEIESEWIARDRERRRTEGPPRVFLNPG